MEKMACSFHGREVSQTGRKKMDACHCVSPLLVGVVILVSSGGDCDINMCLFACSWVSVHTLPLCKKGEIVLGIKGGMDGWREKINEDGDRSTLRETVSLPGWVVHSVRHSCLLKRLSVPLRYRSTGDSVQDGRPLFST